MPRVLVITQSHGRPTARKDAPVLLNEAVSPAHLEDDHAAAQLIERIAWAVSDAEDVEMKQPASAVPTRG